MTTPGDIDSNPQKQSDEDAGELRRGAGHWLKRLREIRGLSQRDLAEKVGVEYYTFISQVESGRGRIPPDRYRDWADALGVPHRDFVIKLMRYYDPVTYRILFDTAS
jgi:transcriptional regulator with XRE-family HTH domain